MTDRELLELAAKACGFGGPERKFCWTGSEYPRGSDKCGALWNYVGHMDSAVLWNPLTDDGDALRLAAGLGMRLTLPKYVGFGTSAEIQRDGIAGCTVFRDDPMEQTRLAIVMAAAELGKAMP